MGHLYLEFVYIANRRYTVREEAKTTVRVYSNCKQIELFVNGASKGKTTGEYGIFVWQDIELKEGNNKIEVVSIDKKVKCADTCTWTHQ